MRVITVIAMKPRTSGRLKIDNQLPVLTGVNKSSSSTESRIEIEVVLFSGKTLARTNSTKRSVPKRSWDQRGGMYVATTRALTNFCFLRTLRASRIFLGRIINEVKAKISSDA